MDIQSRTVINWTARDSQNQVEPILREVYGKLIIEIISIHANVPEVMVRQCVAGVLPVVASVTILLGARKSESLKPLSVALHVTSLHSYHEAVLASVIGAECNPI